MTPIVLVLNSGSSSLKVALFSGASEGPRLLARGAVEGIGLARGRAWLRGEGVPVERELAHVDHAEACTAILDLVESSGAPRATAFGHRVVHGGARHVAPERIDEALVASLRALVPLAPLHAPPALMCIEALARRRPDVPAVACFDTAFHAGMPEVARRLPVGDALDRKGVRRYGFHGLSYEHVLHTIGRPPPRAVFAHLGSGSSLVAVKDGRAVDTTMGFTPAGGVMMGTRTGDLDPGVVLYMLRNEKIDVDGLERVLERESGLAAVGGTPDMKTLLARSDDAARLAVAMFGYSVRKAIGAFAAVLGGLDLVVFTGGIGEHVAAVRTSACEGLGYLGVALDEAKNQANAAIVSPDGAPCAVRVVPADEELVIARHTLGVLGSAPP